MKKRITISHPLYSMIANKEQFYELTFTPDGNLFIDPDLEKATDSFFIYYNGNVFGIQGKSQYCNGVLPKEKLILPTIVGEAAFHAVEGDGCLLDGKEAVLDESISVFAVLHYKDLSAVYIADSTISRAIRFTVTARTAGNDSYYQDIFVRLLHRHDPEAAKHLAFWLMDISGVIIKEWK